MVGNREGECDLDDEEDDLDDLAFDDDDVDALRLASTVLFIDSLKAKAIRLNQKDMHTVLILVSAYWLCVA